MTFTALHVCKSAYVCVLFYMKMNVFQCAHVHRCVCEYQHWSLCACACVCVCVCGMSRQAAVTQRGFSLKWELTGIGENDRCEIMRKDGMGNERAVA